MSDVDRHAERIRAVAEDMASGEHWNEWSPESGVAFGEDLLALLAEVTRLRLENEQLWEAIGVKNRDIDAGNEDYLLLKKDLEIAQHALDAGNVYPYWRSVAKAAEAEQDRLAAEVTRLREEHEPSGDVAFERDPTFDAVVARCVRLEAALQEIVDARPGTWSALGRLAYRVAKAALAAGSSQETP